MRSQAEIQNDPRWARMYVKLTEGERLFIAEVAMSVRDEERERCAVIADEHAKSTCSGAGGETEAMRLGARSISQSIRSQS